MFRRSSRVSRPRTPARRPALHLGLETLEARLALAAGVDLQGWDTYATDAAQWGQTIGVQTAIRNAGNSTSGSFQLQWYLSRDGVGSSDDLLLPQTSGATSYNHAALAGRSTDRDFTVNLKLPAALPTGWTGTGFTVILKTDSANQVAETNEANNFGQVGNTYDRDPITITAPPPQVDLQGGRTAATDSALWGQAISVTTAIRNTGSSPSGAFQLQWYLSRDSVGSSDDLLLPLTSGATSYSHAALAGGSTDTDFSVNLQLPTVLPAGWSGTSFTVILKTDSANQVAETNEANNFGQVGETYDRDPITITAPAPPQVDLAPSAVDGPSGAVAGSTISVSGQVDNRGVDASGSFSVGYYLSTDATITTADVLLKTVSRPGLAGGASQQWTESVTLPASLGAGTYYLGLIADPANAIAETGEANNARADLEPIAITAPPTTPAFTLHSYPGATKRIYLDFNGDSYTGSYWNNGVTVVTPAFSLDADTTTFTSTELARIQAIWERVSEDFLPFAVDVTTEYPGLEALRKVGSTDTEWGIHVDIGGDGAWFGSAGGVAYVGSFNWNTDTPAYVFPGQLGAGNEKYVAEAITHEVGHSLGLSHDGRTSPVEDYYTGQGTGATGWAPIMGAGYYKDLTQWSKGEYAYANNTEDDLAIITTQNGFGYRADDHTGTTISTADALTLTGSTGLSGSGIIERNTDTDFFRFAVATAGNVVLNVNPFYRGPNLDILAELYDAAGVLLQSSNPIDALTATLNLTLAAGTYLLKVDGVGAGSPVTTGYSDYGSLGYYSITGTISAGSSFVALAAPAASPASALAPPPESSTVAVPVAPVAGNQVDHDALPPPVERGGVRLVRRTRQSMPLGSQGRTDVAVDLKTVVPVVDQVLQSWSELGLKPSKTRGRRLQLA